MRIFIYDFEVFAYDWLVVFMDFQTDEFFIFHNDPEGVLEFMDDDAIYIGFNSKSYDQYIMKAVCGGCEPDEVKELNDYLISGHNGWEHPLMQQIRYWFNNVDIMDDMQKGLSLKAIEGHLGMSVQESTVDFNIDHPLTDEELQETIFYCKHDVEATAELVRKRKSYLQNKLHLGRIKHLDDAKSLSMTNAKLTAAYLDAQRPNRPWTDEREYQYPPNLLREYIPQEVFDFFDRMHDPAIPDDVLFKSKLKQDVYGCPTVLAYGGIHGAIPFYEETETEDRIIRNYDVASYYPHLMTICGYTSRNIPDPQIYADMLEERMKAKKAGDKATANALKLVANTTYGAMLNQYNDLFDPLMGRSVCVTGQLFLLELSRHLCEDCPTLKVVQLNTDGIMVSFDKTDYPAVQAIVTEWQERTGFELEEDKIHAIHQKDVNNYVEIPTGELFDDKDKPRWKIKGGYLVRGIAPAGAFNVNNNATVVAEAIVNYFVFGTLPEETIALCDDISKFQIIAKAGAKYREAYHMVDGEKQPVQKVNRVYATKDERYGKLFKVKAEDDATAKIEMLPEHCIIDNDNHLTIDDIDKQFYIDMARKRINDFLGIKPEKPKKERKTKMPRTATPKETPTEQNPMNVLQKLQKARSMFLAEGVKKSGMNTDIEFMYFELKDIVPTATPIFEELGLLPVVYMDKELAYMDMVNTENREDKITFSIPLASWQGNRAVNPIQVIGATVTYYRRYLYQIALDICEADEIDNKPQSVLTDSTPAPAPAPKAPATPQERAEVKKELTNAEGMADALQLSQFKKAMKALKEKVKNDATYHDPVEEWMAQVAIRTKGFTEISKADCAKILTRVSEMMEGNFPESMKPKEETDNG